MSRDMRTIVARSKAVQRACTFVTSAALIVAAIGTADAQVQGRPLTSADWTDTIPIVIGAIVVVLIVNGIGMYFVALSRQRERTAGFTGPIPAVQPAHPNAIVQPQAASETSEAHTATVRIQLDAHGNDHRPTP